jgi:pyruvate,orthophosphate dikinase
LDYVSCSPYRIPIARLAAAHAALADAGSSLPTSKASRAHVRGRKTTVKITKTKSAQRPRSRSRITRKKR